mmetsp:Transcript_22703/g.45641  ORF Transcript_22703/g.45641 Transcript_22703/m.45641 type:complete len:318 (-) Transcript_22703:110-1063(-)
MWASSLSLMPSSVFLSNPHNSIFQHLADEMRGGRRLKLHAAMSSIPSTCLKASSTLPSSVFFSFAAFSSAACSLAFVDSSSLKRASFPSFSSLIWVFSFSSWLSCASFSSLIWVFSFSSWLSCAFLRVFIASSIPWMREPKVASTSVNLATVSLRASFSFIRVSFVVVSFVFSLSSPAHLSFHIFVARSVTLPDLLSSWASIVLFSSSTCFLAAPVSSRALSIFSFNLAHVCLSSITSSTFSSPESSTGVLAAARRLNLRFERASTHSSASSLVSALMTYARLLETSSNMLSAIWSVFSSELRMSITPCGSRVLSSV